MSATFTGVVERCELKWEAPFDPYIGRYDATSHERREYFLDCALRLDDGRTVYFKTPRLRQTIALCPVAAVVMYNADKTDFLEVVGASEKGGEVIMNNSTGKSHVAPTIKVGDTITVKGRVKCEKTSAKGNRYVVLTHCKLCCEY